MAKKLNTKKETKVENEDVIDDTVTISEKDVDKKEDKKVKEDTKNEAKFSVAPNEEKATEKPQSLKKIKLRENHKCHIGGTNYVFVKDEVYTVPISVKEILANAGLLVPLD